ncbi:S41 family peptidase [Candidatus Hydrogenosomobacter endosymbioticus]|uniref:Peptidase S41 n=1 Tax=Candidatus Hydrogenosomobacter endosymbioticus TaxID=2558174 RepID=A0ABN6L772_9PROT|nr:S41 family peptidase [Candidatus Hydrogenosomobacter endosymbioticus]BDB95985.1 peptidase S41 [Candidatus Hydrogenosomobacter endosymbioticus]
MNAALFLSVFLVSILCVSGDAISGGGCSDKKSVNKTNDGGIKDSGAKIDKDNGNREPGDKADNKKETTASDISKDEAIGLISAVSEFVKKEYVKEISYKDLCNTTINGMLSSLDPHSSYFTREEFEDMSHEVNGEFGGLGLEVGAKDGVIEVISPIDSSPAQEAGIMCRDLIVAIDGVPVQGMRFLDVVKKMRGKPGTVVTLLIKREGSPIITKKLTRAMILVKSVKYILHEGDIGYVRISTFDSKVTSLLKDAIVSIKKKAKNRLKGFVIDLRNNPGGLLDQAISACGLFFSDKAVVSTRGRDMREQIFSAPHGQDVIGNIPVVVLVNEGSASASEIMAGALQDNKAALVVGVNSFGKGSVQRVVPIGENGKLGGVRLTVALFYTPSGKVIQTNGIKPDIYISQDTVVSKESQDLKFREKDLHGVLRPENMSKDAADKIAGKFDAEYKKGRKEASEGFSVSPGIDGGRSSSGGQGDSSGADKSSDGVAAAIIKKEDYQLMRAVELVRGLWIFDKNKECSGMKKAS